MLPFLRRFPLRNFPLYRTLELLQARRIEYSQLYTAIMMMQDLKCQDPRDRVYGTLAVINWKELDPIVPNYKISIFHLTIQVLEKLAELHDVELRQHQVAEHGGTSVLPTAAALVSVIGVTSASEEFKRATELRQGSELLPWPQITRGFFSRRYRDNYWFGWQIPSSNCWERVDKSEDQDVTLHCSATVVTSTVHTEAHLFRIYTPIDEIGNYEAILLAGSARPNDWVAVARSRPGHSDHNACLVLRQQGDKFAVVGRGLRHAHRKLAGVSKDEHTLHPQMEHFEVRFDAEDLLVLIVQTDLDSTIKLHQGTLQPSVIDRLRLGLATKICRTEWSSYAVKVSSIITGIE